MGEFFFFSLNNFLREKFKKRALQLLDIRGGYGQASTPPSPSILAGPPSDFTVNLLTASVSICYFVITFLLFQNRKHPLSVWLDTIEGLIF